MSWDAPNMMYNQARQSLRQQVPQNIRSTRQPAPNNLMATSPANNVYQQQTTMFVTPNQPSPYMTGVTGQSHVITMPGGGTVQPGPLIYPPHTYTINTSQPAQFAVTPTTFYPQSPAPPVYYHSQSSGMTSQTIPQPQQPTQQPQPQQPQQVTQTSQPQRPGSQSGHQNTLPKRERKALAIIDPETGKEINAGLQPGKTATPQVASGSSGTPVANTPPPQQPGIPSSVQQPPVQQPPSQTNAGNSEIAAQFAAQVAATLNPKAHNAGVKSGQPQAGPTSAGPTVVQSNVSMVTPPQMQQPPSVAQQMQQPQAAPQQMQQPQAAPQQMQQPEAAPQQMPPPQAAPQQMPQPQAAPQQIQQHPVAPQQVHHQQVAPQQVQQSLMATETPQMSQSPAAAMLQNPNVNSKSESVAGSQPVQILQDPNSGPMLQKGGMAGSASMPYPQGPQNNTTYSASTAASPNVHNPPPAARQPTPTTQDRLPHVPPTSVSIPVSGVVTASQNLPPSVSQPSSVPVLAATPVSSTVDNKTPPQARQSPPTQIVSECPRMDTPESSPKTEVSVSQQPKHETMAEHTKQPPEVALTAETKRELVAERKEERASVEREGSPVTKEEEESVETPTTVPKTRTLGGSTTREDPPISSSGVRDTTVKTEIKEERSTASVKDQLEERKPEPANDQDKKRNPPRQRLKESEDNVLTEVPKHETLSNKVSPTPSANIPEITVHEPKATEEVKVSSPAPPSSVVPPVVDIAITDGANKQAVISPSTKVTPPLSAAKAQQEVDDPQQEVVASVQEVENKREERKEVKLKYEYKEDQWSPLNMEGKKSYDRQFLLKLQYASQSTLKPAGLPDLPELVLDNPLRTPTADSYNRSNQNTMDFTPGYIRPTSGRGPMTKSRSQQRAGGGRSESRRVISINREPEVQLSKAENPYKPAYMQPKPATVEGECAELYRKVRSILNKLTPQKFGTLMQQILDLNINSEEKLKGVIDIIFEKAIDEPAFSVAYANCCKIMTQQVKVASQEDPKVLVTFKNLLLNRCQTEFEKDKKDATQFEQMQKDIEAAETEEKKKELTEEMELAESKAKRRSLGNIRFIGELFKLNMLTERIMHDCIMNLLKSNDEENLECLCRLVSTIGKGLDHEKGKQLMNQYFTRIEKIIKTKTVSSRIRFMLQDVVDLRQNNWKPRRDDNNPKTIEQIHKEAEEEKVEKAAQSQRIAMEQKHRMGPGNRGRGGMQPSPDEHGWQAVVTGKTNRIDPSKMKLSKTNVDDNIQLGPGGKFGGWGRGSTGGGKNASQEKERPSTPGNRFSALSGGGATSEGDARRHMAGRTPMSSSRERNVRLAPANSRQMARTSQEKDREAAIKAARNISAGRGDPGRLTPSGSRNQSRESSRNREEPSKPVLAAPPVQEMSDQVLERKTKATLDEYLTNHDLKEAVECTKEIPLDLRHKFTDICIQHVLERSDVTRRMCGILLHDLVKTGVLSVDQYLQGLKETLEFAEDMEIDIPKIWLYLGQLIGPMVQDGSVPLSFLKSACEPLLICNKAGLLVSEVLNDAVHRLGHVQVGEQWKKSGLQWSEFVEKDVDQFIKEHKLEYTLHQQQEPLSPVGKGLSDDKVQVELDRLIKDKRTLNEDVFDWVDTNVGEANIKKPAFIRALMTSVCSSAITGHREKWGVETSIVKERGPLLQRYLFEHDSVLELQALYALQALVHKLQHPQDVLRIFFDTLYDEDIISEDAFNQWDNSIDQAEQAGRGVARKSVVQFFRWLREAEEEEQES